MQAYPDISVQSRTLLNFVDNEIQATSSVDGSKIADKFIISALIEPSQTFTNIPVNEIYAHISAQKMNLALRGIMITDSQISDVLLLAITVARREHIAEVANALGADERIWECVFDRLKEKCFDENMRQKLRSPLAHDNIEYFYHFRRGGSCTFAFAVNVHPQGAVSVRPSINKKITN